MRIKLGGLEVIASYVHCMDLSCPCSTERGFRLSSLSDRLATTFLEDDYSLQLWGGLLF